MYRAKKQSNIGNDHKKTWNKKVSGTNRKKVIGSEVSFPLGLEKGVAYAELESNNWRQWVGEKIGKGPSEDLWEVFRLV